MKRLLIILGIGLTIGMMNVNTVEAQIVNMNVYVNIDMQPAWGPAGYNYAAFYYFPALNIYYDINNAIFYYLYRQNWIATYFLPARYQRYDLYTLYKVVINDYPQPWQHFRIHRTMYAPYRNVRTQTPIRYMTNDYRYNVARTNIRAWVDTRPVTNRQSGPNSNVARNNPNIQNRNTTIRPSTPQTNINRNQSNNQGVRNQNSTRNNQNTTVTPRQNTPTNRTAPGPSTPQTNVNRNQNNNQGVSNQNSTRSNQNTTVTPRQNTPTNRTAPTRSNNSTTTRSTVSTRSSR